MPILNLRLQLQDCERLSPMSNRRMRDRTYRVNQKSVFVNIGVTLNNLYSMFFECVVALLSRYCVVAIVRDCTVFPRKTQKTDSSAPLPCIALVLQRLRILGHITVEIAGTSLISVEAGSQGVLKKLTLQRLFQALSLRCSKFVFLNRAQGELGTSQSQVR